MDELNRYIPQAKGYILPGALGAIGICFIVFGIFSAFSESKKEEIVFEEAKEPEIREIVVDVEGAVISPGVYTLPSDGRIKDALSKAGGLSEEADREYVEKNINLASKLADGVKLYIPKEGENIGTSFQTSIGQEVLGTNLTNINSATPKELEDLPGIGPVTAQKIIDGRPYAGIEDLMIKKVITSSVFEKIKNLVTAN